MEDLCVDKFDVKDKHIPSDCDHIEKLFTTLAKFHGISLAMKLKKPLAFEKFKSMNNSMCKVMTTNSMKHIAPRNCELASKLFDDGAVCNKILSFKDNLWHDISKILDGKRSEPFSVICHGDVWINNVMYNYESEMIKDVRLIDWQMTFYGSLGSELMYYLFCCVDKDTRLKHQDELLLNYYEMMKKTLAKFDLNIDKVLPQHEFYKQLKDFGLYAFGMSIFAIPILCKYPEKLFDDENVELTGEERECVENYNRRMRFIILDMIEMGILK
jgi:hypothetical protein